MRILMVSPQSDGCWFVWLLRHNGHDCDWITTSPKDAETLSGIIPPPLAKPPDPARYDLVVFDSSGLGEAADDARKVTPTIGSSVLADRLEHDRLFGLEAMEQAGIAVPEWESFDDRAKAINWLRQKERRTVLKPLDDENLPKDTTYVSKSSEDMIHYIEHKLIAKVKSFVLQTFVEGTEVSTEAWWTGDKWVAVNHTLEEKKFMAGGIGPNTGCAGNVVWMPERTNAIFQRGLEKIAPLLQAHDFVGMVDLNTIVTSGEAYGLEWTPRFGYEGTCNLTRLLPIEFGDFLSAVAIGDTPVYAGSNSSFAATVRLSVPPYPNAESSRRRDHVPIQGLTPEDLTSFILYDVRKEDDQLVTGGNYQVIGAPIGLGADIAGAFDEVEAAIKRLDVPDLQYRNDIKKCVEARYASLRTDGWLRPIG